MNPNKQHPKQSPQPHPIPSSTPHSSHQPHQSASTSTFHVQSTPSLTPRQQSSCSQNVHANIENKSNKQLDKSKLMLKQEGRMMIEGNVGQADDSGKNQWKNVVFRGNSIENRYVKKGFFFQNLFEASVWDLSIMCCYVGNRQFVDMNVADLFVMLEQCGAIILMLGKLVNIQTIISTPTQSKQSLTPNSPISKISTLATTPQQQYNPQPNATSLIYFNFTQVLTFQPKMTTPQQK